MGLLRSGRKKGAFYCFKMLVGELVLQNEARTDLIREDLNCLSAFSVHVLLAEEIQREILRKYQTENCFEKRLQFLAITYTAKMHSSSLLLPPVANRDAGTLQKKASLFSFSLALKVCGVVLGVARTMLRGRSKKLQQVLLRYSMMIYYAVFRVSSLVR